MKFYVEKSDIDFSKTANSSVSRGDLVALEDSDGKFFLAVVGNGYYLDPTYGRLSNTWTMIEVQPDGTMGEEFAHHYSSFYYVTTYKTFMKVVNANEDAPVKEVSKKSRKKN